MKIRFAILVFLASNIASVPLVQAAPVKRIDPGAVIPAPEAGSASPAFISRVTYGPVDVVCPEEHGTIEIKSGQMFLTRVNRTGMRLTLDGNSPSHARPVDDETYQYEIGNAECRLAMRVRLQIRLGDEWRTAPLPYWSRPSVPREEKADLAKAMMEMMKTRRGTESPPPLPPPPQMLGDGSSIGEAFFYDRVSEAAPETGCFQAAGSYEIGPGGVSFIFLGALPGDLNRFAIERDDINRYQGRLLFTNATCRFQITVGGSVKSGVEWVPMTIDNPI